MKLWQKRLLFIAVVTLALVPEWDGLYLGIPLVLVSAAAYLLGLIESDNYEHGLVDGRWKAWSDQNKGRLA